MTEFLHPLDTPKMRRKFEVFLEKEKNRPTEKEKAEIKILERQALNLWKLAVKARAGGQCEFSPCRKKKFLNAHHIESYTTNKLLRYDPENGVCLCPTHHKFGWISAHRSFCFLYDYLTRWRQRSLSYLLQNYQRREPMTKERLQEIIRGLSVYEKKRGRKR